MAASTIPKMLEQLRRHEGGYVNHPRDPGGATKWGVTHATYDAYRRGRGLPTRSVRDMTETEYQAILREQFWRPMRCDELPPGLDYATFDGGWGSGPKRGIRWLQRTVGTTQDGLFGPLTLAAVRRVTDVPAAVRTYCRYRLGFMRGLTSLWSVFGRGWAARVAEVEALAVGLALAADGCSRSAIAAHAEREAGRADAAKTQNQAGAAAGAAVGGVDAAHLGSGGLGWPAIWALAAVLALAIGTVAALLWRAHVARQRARAYAELARGSAEQP